MPKSQSREPKASSRGFTLLELMVVMSLIVILASLALVQYRQSITLSREAVLKEDLFRMNEAIDQYYADKNKYPATLQDLVADKYLRIVPVDPFTASTETWQTTQSEADPRNPTAPSGVYDVKSGSDRQSMEGTAYADW